MSETTPEAPETAQNGPEAAEDLLSPGNGSEGPQTFSADYVKSLREENAKYRNKGKRADDLARTLVTEYARGTGTLVDASDLPYSEELLDHEGTPDPERVREAVEALVASKPHLARLAPRGDVGQGVQQTDTVPGLADMLRAGAG